MCYWQEESEQDLDQLLREFCSSPGPVSRPLFNLPDLDSPPAVEPLFLVHKRKSLTLAPLKRQTKITKHYCSYITKRIIREFNNPLFTNEVHRILTQNDITLSSMDYLLHQLQMVSGPIRLLQVLDTAEKSQRAVFLQFGRWYLEARYIRHLIREGRTEERAKYVQFKNKQMKALLRRAARKP